MTISTTVSGFPSKPFGLTPLIFASMLGLIFCAGCESPPGAPGSDGSSSEIATSYGLRKAETGLPGVLYIRDGHAIGSYDAFLIPESTITYQAGSKALPPDMEEEFLAVLEQTLIDAARDAEIPIMRSSGPCVMQVGMGLTNVEISRRSGQTIGEMTLVMEFEDTESGDRLLHYATRNRIENTDGATRKEQLRATFEEMVAAMEISGALRAAGLVDEVSRPPCQGTLAKRGSARASSVSAR